jgi:multidrug efflux system membrane fusion protein
MLEKVLCEEGASVKKGDELFRIDDRPYRAELDKARAQVARATARATFCLQKKAQVDRLRRRNKNTVSDEEIQKTQAECDEADADVSEARASLGLAELNAGFTRVLAPIDGVIGRVVSAGNLAVANTAVLATLVSVDPMQVLVEVDERSALRLVRLKLGAKNAAGSDAAATVQVGVADEADLPRRGRIVFTDNRVNAATGTLRVRALVPNPDGMLLPGMSARVRLHGGNSRELPMIPHSAVRNTPGMRAIVCVVMEDNRIELRRIKGQNLGNGLMLVEHGLNAKEWVVVDGLKELETIGPGTLVEPERVSLGPDGALKAAP